MSDTIAPEVPVVASEIPASEAEVSEAVEAAAPEVEAAPAKEAKKIEAEIKKWKLKIDGQDQELTEDELVKHAQLGKAAHKRMEEAALLRKNMEAFVDLLRKDPVRVLSDPNLGVDVKQLAHSIINGELEEMKKSPDQKKTEQLQKELEEYKRQAETEKKSREEAEFKRLQENTAVQLENDIQSALETSGLPKTPYTVKKMADIMMVALKNDIDLSPKEVVGIMRRDMQAELKQMFSVLPEDVVEELVGKDNISKLRKRSLQKLKQIASAESVKATGATEIKKTQDEKPKEKMRLKDFLKNLG